MSNEMKLFTRTIINADADTIRDKEKMLFFVTNSLTF
jgi:hypothetical protein